MRARVAGECRVTCSPARPCASCCGRWPGSWFGPNGKPGLFNGKGTPSRARLYIDGQNEFPVTTPVVFSPGGLACGASPVIPDYQPTFKFTGSLHTVTIDLSGDLITSMEAEMRIAMARH